MVSNGIHVNIIVCNSNVWCRGLIILSMTTLNPAHFIVTTGELLAKGGKAGADTVGVV